MIYTKYVEFYEEEYPKINGSEKNHSTYKKKPTKTNRNILVQFVNSES